MENKIRINLDKNLELVAELYNHDGEHQEIVVYIEKNMLVHQDICLVRHNEEDGDIECITWSDCEDEDYTHKFKIGIYKEE